jgi:hypothetical protein
MPAPKTSRGSSGRESNLDPPQISLSSPASLRHFIGLAISDSGFQDSIDFWDLRTSQLMRTMDFCEFQVAFWLILMKIVHKFRKFRWLDTEPPTCSERVSHSVFMVIRGAYCALVIAAQCEQMRDLLMGGRGPFSTRRVVSWRPLRWIECAKRHLVIDWFPIPFPFFSDTFFLFYAS